ncbi:hypothetical protein CEF21_05080 [Bacillus sp. FJAT-42376]|uniref:hypothetical protein n=1 Tax=Bacillus sp. FJAT-42376 TaxID=2014076 RepID=UPI000F514290|nr:hypothetical protein [Bacillus sp. FJAT-42376]AZB41723.1 hypothetical protein CEF21_05080 [Bacillus sp. FJAT-42376]
MKKKIDYAALALVAPLSILAIIHGASIYTVLLSAVFSVYTLIQSIQMYRHSDDKPRAVVTGIAAIGLGICSYWLYDLLYLL